jgi:hypothetical protein
MIRQEQRRWKRKYLLTSNLLLQIKGTLLKGTWSGMKERAKETGMETDPPPE